MKVKSTLEAMTNDMGIVSYLVGEILMEFKEDSPTFDEIAAAVRNATPSGVCVNSWELTWDESAETDEVLWVNVTPKDWEPA